ncbi:MAG: hypothetical protein L0211_02020, partial [Planctomycetaceae bacterium]|nr:hypothetical protein [Planctomycetaceae bacterium]
SAHPGSRPMLHSAWLAQLIGHEVQQWFGNEGLVFGHALLMTAIAGVLMWAVVCRGAPPQWAWAAGAAMFVLDLPIHGTIRPQLFGQLGAALFLLAAAQLPTRRHPLVWVPIVAALWANLHGSILMGLAILGAFAGGMTWNLLVEHQWNIAQALRDARFARAWGALVLALAASCLNPHGPLLLVKTIFFGEHAALSSISEWQATRFSSLTGMLLLASLAASLALAKLSPRKWELFEILILAAFALATFSAIRMLAWWALAWPVVAVPHAAAAWRAWQSGAGFQPAVAGKMPAPLAGDEPTSMRTLVAMGVIFMTALLAPPSFAVISGQGRGDGPSMVSETPLYLADEVARRGLAGNIAAPMDWADYLIWKTEGRLKPLVYSHVHLAEVSTWKDHKMLFAGDPKWLAVLNAHQMQYVVASRQRHPELAKAALLDSRGADPRVRILYQDQRCLLAEVLPTGKRS